MKTIDYIKNKYSQSLDWKVQIRGYGRGDLAKDFFELGFTKGAEIGTERGKFAKVLLENNPYLKLWCIDPWMAYNGDVGYKNVGGQNGHDRNYRRAEKRLRHFNCILLKEFSSEAVSKFEDESLDFVYIDGNHRLDYVVSDLISWTPKVKNGGIVAGHDFIKYKHQCHSHVPQALDAYFSSYGVKQLYLMDCKDYKKSKEENRYMDRIRSWFFIK